MTIVDATASISNAPNSGPDKATTLAQMEVPKSMVEALETEDPSAALIAIAQDSKTRAHSLAEDLAKELQAFAFELPDLLKKAPPSSTKHQDMDTAHPVSTAMVCSESILQSLTKIASGGSQASQEIQQLEEEKRELEKHSQDVETALILRQASDAAAQSLSARRYEQAAQAIRDFLAQKDNHRLTPRAKAYAGEYTVTQLESTKAALQKSLLKDYQQAVQESSLMTLGKLTPLVQMVQMEQEAVGLYLRFLKQILSEQLSQAAATSQDDRKKPPYVPMARVYNTAVTILRHHLPMVSHCLHKADGDAAVVQLVHLQVEEAVQPLFQSYIKSRQLALCAQNSQEVYALLEEKYTTFHRGMDETEDGDDCGFASQVGTLADVDAAMEEAALLLQHAESYTRFINHTVKEVNKARQLRHQQSLDSKRQERERQEWATGTSFESKEDMEDYKALEILPTQTRLEELLAEVGGYYSAIERCLLLASMQRAFVTPEEDMRNYAPMPKNSQSMGLVGSKALHSSMIEACLYAARRGVQRAFATGHNGTAAAMANYASDCLKSVLVEYLSRRCEDWGVTALKPGEGLLEGSGGIFSSSLLAGGQAVPVVGGKVDEVQRRKEIEEGIALACATLNDLEIASHHTQDLEKLLTEGVEKGYPPSTHATEQLLMCVKSLAPVSEVLDLSSKTSIESLVSVLKPRIRAIVTDAVGSGDTAQAAFAGVMGGNKMATDRHSYRMNYNLDEQAYQLLEVSEGYISRLCTCLDELIIPLSTHLSSKLSDELVLGVLGTVAKRLEVSLKKCQFTSLGALSLDSDMRDLLNYSKDRLDSNELSSNIAFYRACTPLARLVQIAKLLNVDDLDDVLDLISASKRKGNWDLKLEDAKAYLSLRVEFEADRIQELLRLPDGE